MSRLDPGEEAFQDLAVAHGGRGGGRWELSTLTGVRRFIRNLDGFDGVGSICTHPVFFQRRRVIITWRVDPSGMSPKSGICGSLYHGDVLVEDREEFLLFGGQIGIRCGVRVAGDDQFPVRAAEGIFFWQGGESATVLGGRWRIGIRRQGLIRNPFDFSYRQV